CGKREFLVACPAQRRRCPACNRRATASLRCSVTDLYIELPPVGEAFPRDDVSRSEIRNREPVVEKAHRSIRQIPGARIFLARGHEVYSWIHGGNYECFQILTVGRIIRHTISGESPVFRCED